MAKVNKQIAQKAYNVGQKPDETLEHYYRRLAKTADQRLVRLERASKEQYFAPAKDWAYASAMRDIHTWNGQTASRFNTAPPSKPEKLVAKINDIKKFLNSPTSTKVGIKNVYIKKANKFNKDYGTSFTWDQVAAYYDKKLNEKMDRIFGSKTALKAIGRVMGSMQRVKQTIEEVSVNDFKSSDQDVIDIQIQKNLKAIKMTIKRLE